MKMDVWSLKRQHAAWTVMNILCVFSHEVTVRNSDLRLCERDKKVCVTDLRDCGPGPPSTQRSLKMSCYYIISEKSMACDWREESYSHTELDVSFIFRSQDEILSCMGIFNPAAILNITARIKNQRKHIDNWSLPHTVFLYDAIKPSQPVLTILRTSADAVVVSWRSSGDSGCQLRYRESHAHTWTQAPDFVPAHEDQTLAYMIQDLLPFTIYKVAVACRSESGIWSSWSSDVTAKTLDRVPSRPPEVCYRVEQTNSSRTLLLYLFWKDTDLNAAGGHVAGYQVSYEPVTKLPFILNYTGRTALLEVEEGNCTITVRAFNTAGYGPAARVSFDTQRHNTLPPVRHLWLSSSSSAGKSLQVQWEHPTASHSLPPISHFGVQWHSETHVSTSRWTTTDSFTTSAIIEDVDPHESYLISVFPVYKQQCGSSQSLPASLQHGALMEVVKLWVVSVTKTTVTLAWMWQRKSESIRVDTYKVEMRKDLESQTLSLWPDQWQHTFHNLEANTEYSAHLLADGVSIVITPVRTEFDEVPAVAAVTPLLLLALSIFIVSILFRTLYKSYFFPPISSPWDSAAGQWLMDPNHKKTRERTVLDLEDFQVTDILGKKSPIMISPKSQPTTEEEDLLEDDSLVSMSHLIIQMSALQVDLQYVSDVSGIPEQQLDSLRSRHPDRAFKSEQSPAVDSYFPQKDKEQGQVDFSERFPETETVFKSFCEFIANAKSHCASQLICEADYVVNSSPLGKTDVEAISGKTGCSYLKCETDYLPNSCFTGNITSMAQGTYGKV